MVKEFKNSERGLVKLIILIIVLILVLSYFGINIQKIAESETGQANFGYVWRAILSVWDYLVSIWRNYLSTPIMNLWNQLPWTK